MARARRPSALATWAAVLGGLAIALGVAGLWAQRTLGEPDAIAALAGEILEQPGIRTELAVVLVDPALEEAPSAVRAQREVIVATTAQVLGSGRFVPLFEDVLRRAATRLTEGEGAVRLELEGPLEQVVAAVEPLSPDLAAELAAIEPPAPEVVSEREADRLRSVIAVQAAASVSLLVVGAGLVLAAVARNDARALMPFGATLAGAGLVLLGALLLGRAVVLDAIEPRTRAQAAEVAWDIVVADLRTALLASASVGGLALVVGAFLGRRA